MLAGVYHVPRLTSSCTVRSCITHEGFPIACKSTKMCFPGCKHAEHVFLLAGTAHVNIKSKSSCTIAKNHLRTCRQDFPARW